MIRKIVWHLYGLCAFTARMVVVVAGCIALTVFVTGWEDLDWRFNVICGLFFASYLFAASIEFLADQLTKSAKQEEKS